MAYCVNRRFGSLFYILFGVVVVCTVYFLFFDFDLLTPYLQLDVSCKKVNFSKYSDGEDLSVFVTLTSIPRRLPYLWPTIHSLIHQTTPVNILLYLPRHSRVDPEPYAAPAFLQNLSCVQVKWVDFDYGPATKYIPALLESEEGKSSGFDKKKPPLLIVVDDDIIYPEWFVDHMISEHLRSPNDAICLRGWIIPSSRDWKDSGVVFGQDISQRKQVAVITGTHGYAVTSAMFNVTALAAISDVPKAVTFVDDVWISGHLSWHNVQKFVTPVPQQPRSNILIVRPISLLDSNRRDNNNVALKYFLDRGVWKAGEFDE